MLNKFYDDIIYRGKIKRDGEEIMIKNKVVALVVAILLSIPVTVNCYGEINENYGLQNPRIIESQHNENVTWDCVYFGNYYQSSSEYKEPIKWRVLYVNGNNAFLLADKCLDVMQYNYSLSYISWENCTLRSWLNGYTSDYNLDEKDYENNNFVNTAFSQVEKNAILDTNVVNEEHYLYGTDGGNDTVDKIFVLSLNEILNESYGFLDDVTKYDKAKDGVATQYMADGGTFHESFGDRMKADKSHYWWLRTPGDDLRRAVRIYSGKVRVEGEAIVLSATGVRPALHLDLSQADVWKPAGSVRSDGTSNKYSLSELATAESVTVQNIIGITTIKEETIFTNRDETEKQGTSNKTNISKAKIKSVKNQKKKSIIVKYKKLTNAKQYQIQYALDKKFTKTVKTKKTKKISYKIKKLKKKKTYYIRVRGINGKSKGKWSQVKKVRVKK